MKASYKRHVLNFKTPGGTSRGVLTQKETWYLIIEDNGKKGVGECGVLRGLSIDDRPDYEQKLQWVCEHISLGSEVLWSLLLDFPSIQFGIEIAFLSLEATDPFVLFPSSFSKGLDSIPINGLIWMGTTEEMKRQIDEKLKAGFTCIKLKIGAIDFDEELAILRFIRTNYTASEIEIRVDANGAFTSHSAFSKLSQLTEFELHSIEQPIEIKQHDIMSELCKLSQLPIALDEELIGVTRHTEKQVLLQKIKPQFIILKPSLIGGIKGASEWIKIAEENSIGWWITSALESNIGLNAIAQWTYTLNNPMPQGLGTGGLYTNNIESPLTVRGGRLHYDVQKTWVFPLLD
ncbi:MAG TPA: o-succinylbenzoate synthase [Flavobacterium sp.]|jgi:o-succinylbenzoate synthase